MDLQTESALHFADTPEAALIAVPNLDPLCLDDILLCTLTRHSALLDVLQREIAAPPDHRLPDGTLLGLLWCLQGQVEQMRTLIRATPSHIITR